MSTVGAYVELKPGEEPPLHSFSLWAEADFYRKTPNGLEVSWGASEEDPPVNAQVYLAWEPRVYAVWNEEIENGENGEYEDDGLTGPGGEAADPEPDEDSGEGGEGYGDVQAPGTYGGSEEAE